MATLNMISVDQKYELNKGLFDTPVENLIWKERTTLSVDCDTLVEKALSMMIKHQVSSLAVKNKEGGWQGILNMGDIAAHMSGFVMDESVAALTHGSESESHRHFQPKPKDQGDLKFPCCHLLGLTWESRRPMIIDAKEPLHQVLVKLSSGCHRALIQGSGWFQVVSQWDIAVWLARHRDLNDADIGGNKSKWLGSLVNGSIGELGLTETKHLVSIPHDMNVMEGMRRIIEAGVSALPVIGGDGTLWGTLSVNDLRYIDMHSADKLKSLSMLCIEFLRAHNLTKLPQAVATKETPFGDVLARIYNREVHRVWLIYSDNKPFGVVSLTDILRKLSQWLHESSMGGGSFGGSKITSGEMKGETRARSGSSGMKESLPHHGGGGGGVGHEQAHHISRSEQQDHDKQELFEHHFDPKSVKLGGGEAPMDLSGIFDPQQQQQGGQQQQHMKKAKAHHPSRMEQQDHDKSELMEGHFGDQPAIQPQSQTQQQPHHISRTERQDYDKAELLGLSEHEIQQRKTDDKMASRGTTTIGGKCAAGVANCTCVGTCTCQQKRAVEQQKVGKGLQHASGKGVKS